jgi:very-short-patch-repair endonuclease
LDASQQVYDERRTRFLEDVRGFRVKRLTNEEADKLSDEELLAFVS